MRKFEFTLAAFQKTKEIQESQVRKRMTELNHQWMAAKEVEEQIENGIRNLQEQWLVILNEGTDVLSLQNFDHCMDNMTKQLTAQRMQVEKIDRERTACRNELLKIMGEIKGLEKLKENQYEEYLLECKKEQELEIDEFVTYSQRK